MIRTRKRNTENICPANTKGGLIKPKIAPSSKERSSISSRPLDYVLLTGLIRLPSSVRYTTIYFLSL